MGERVLPDPGAGIAATHPAWAGFDREAVLAPRRPLLSTDFGELLATAAPTLDLAEVYASRSIVYFALPVARFPETAPLVAKLIIADLNAVAGLVQDGTLRESFASVVIDEFAADGDAEGHASNALGRPCQQELAVPVTRAR